MRRKLKRWPSLDSAVGRIAALLAVADDADKASGVVWYSEAHKFAHGLASDTGIGVRAVCHVIAVLSPACIWKRNKTDARAVCLEFIKTGRVTETEVSTYGQNRAKAERILVAWFASEPWDNILSGPKVTAFARNIENPNNLEDVTLDTHALSIALGIHYTATTCPDPRPAIKDRYRRAYQIVARATDLSPCQVQAITWLCWRRKHYVDYGAVLKTRGEEI